MVYSFLALWMSEFVCVCLWSLYSLVVKIVLPSSNQLGRCPRYFVHWDTFYNTDPYINVYRIHTKKLGLAFRDRALIRLSYFSITADVFKFSFSWEDLDTVHFSRFFFLWFLFQHEGVHSILIQLFQNYLHIYRNFYFLF